MNIMEEARFYEKMEKEKITCHLCAHECVIEPGKRGICMVRENQGGRLFSLVYGRIVSQGNDPIEKKPLFHFLPGTRSFSIATVGCNMQCQHCQNYEISQYPRHHELAVPGQECTPESIVRQAMETHAASMSYTYIEPTIFAEFAYDTAVLAREQGIRNIFVSNGFMTEKSAGALAGVLDGNNIDLKSFSDDFYRRICKARLQPVVDTIALMKGKGVWVEVTTLVIPGLNDSDTELRDIAHFIREIGAEIPWHVSAFHPTYRMLERPRTPVETLLRARNVGRDAGLRYVYTGNIPGEGGESTRCHGCGERVIERIGYTIRNNRLQDGCCPGCGAEIPGVWQ